MFNARTNISTIRVLKPRPRYYGPVDWPLTARNYPSMCPLYINADGFALSLLVSRGYYPGTPLYYGGMSLMSVALSIDWTVTISSYPVVISSSTLHSQDGQNFSIYSDYQNPSTNYYGDGDIPNLTTSQVILIVIFSTLLPWIVYGAVRCCKARNKKKSVGNEYLDSNNIPAQSSDKGKNKKKKRKQDSKKSTRTKSKAWSIASWKQNRKRGDEVNSEVRESGAQTGQSDRAERTEDNEEDDSGLGSEDPPGSKICESEETHVSTTATESNPATLAATAFGVTVMHGGLEDAGPLTFRRLSARRVSDSGGSSNTALGDDQPPGTVDPTGVGLQFTSPMESMSLSRHRLWSVVTSLSSQSPLPHHQRQEQQLLPSSPTTSMAASSIPSATEAHAALTGITIENTRPLPLLTGIGAAPLTYIPMSVISSSEHPPQQNQPRWTRANSTPRAHLTVSTTRTIGSSSVSPPATPILAIPSAPPIP